MTWAYYNEIDAYCAQWLRNLMTAGHIPAGHVDERDIREVSGDDLEGFGQCHFFAGLGGWAYAGRLAGVPDDFPLWTGSCPCQPLSSAGQRKGHADERHLWPAFQSLIAECRPAVVFGEQVASKLGREWLAGVRADLESMGYAVGAADLPAAGVGAPHIRQRLWWVAQPNGGHTSAEGLQRGGEQRQQPEDGGIGGGLGIADGAGSFSREQAAEAARHWSSAVATGCAIPCADGKARRVEPSIQPLVTRLPAAVDGLGTVSRIGALRAAGNSIVPQVAAEFMMACLEDV